MILRVFEQQTLKIGDRQNEVQFTEAHWNSLTKFHVKASKYYSLTHRGVRFTQYVGVLQVNNLTIEILPKADRNNGADHAIWHGVLLDMLRYTKLLKVESLSTATLRLRNHSILELYYDIFLTEVEHLLKTGLIKSYRRQREQSPVLKGKLVLSEHLQRNLLHRERFFIDYQKYDYDHFFHQVIYATLLRLGDLLQRADLRTRQQRLLRYFPPQTLRHFKADDFRNLHFNRQTLRYKNAIEVARLLLLNYSPDLRGGQHEVLAILFDMNLLFEEYVYQQLKHLPQDGILVTRQHAVPFWNRRIIRPDLLLEIYGERIVLDTKWKVLEKVRPAMSDVKQMYIYNRYYGAKRGALLYPQVDNLSNLPPTAYQSVAGETTYCQIEFLEIVRAGKLNRDLGENLLQNLLDSLTN